MILSSFLLATGPLNKKPPFFFVEQLQAHFGRLTVQVHTEAQEEVEEEG